MVFGELLGGLAMRGGQRMHEDLLRQRKIEDWQREQTLGQWQDFVSKNWDNMDAGQQQATIDQLAPMLGKKPKDLYPMVTASKAIHGMIPQIQAVPEMLGSTQRKGPVTATPSTEPPVRGIAAPDTIQIGQIPQPGELLSPSIMAPTTGGTASFGRDMTPNQMIAQQKFEQGQAERAQRIREIQLGPLPDRYKQMAIAQAQGLPIVPYESTVARSESHERIAKGKEDDIKNVGYFVQRGGQQFPVYMTQGLGPMWDDPTTGVRTPFKFNPATDKRLEKPFGLGTVTGARDVYSFNRDTGETNALDIGIKPAVVNAGAQRSREFKDELALSKDYQAQPAVKEFAIANKQYERAKSAMAQAARPGAPLIAVDQTLITVFNKMIDELSVVRESEYARSAQNQSFINRVQGQLTKQVQGGNALATEDRNALSSMINEFYKISSAGYQQQRAHYTGIATEYGFKPERVLRFRGEGAEASVTGDYGPVQDFDYNGKIVKGRRNTKTGKIKLEP